MPPEPSFDELSTTEQVILLAIADRHRADDTPVQTHEVRKVCRTRLESVDREVVGTIDEADVMRSLYRLEDEGFVEEHESARTSPTGKGRPGYALSIDPETVYESVDDDLLEEEDRDGGRD